jgi:hypothetical protein
VLLSLVYRLLRSLFGLLGVRQLSGRKWTYTDRRRPGRPSTSTSMKTLIVRMARENPAWGTGESKVSWRGSGPQAAPIPATTAPGYRNAARPERGRPASCPPKTRRHRSNQRIPPRRVTSARLRYSIFERYTLAGTFDRAASGQRSIRLRWHGTSAPTPVATAQSHIMPRRPPRRGRPHPVQGDGSPNLGLADVMHLTCTDAVSGTHTVRFRPRPGS